MKYGGFCKILTAPDLVKLTIMYAGPSKAPSFRRSKIMTHSTGLDIYWDPPPISSINGEFLGYILTYRPAERYDKKVIEVRDESLKTQVIGRGEIGVVIILSVFIELFTEWSAPPHKLHCYAGRQKSGGDGTRGGH